MANYFANHTPNCKIPPCKGGCQNVVCHEHVDCCMRRGSTESFSCAPQCRGSYDHLTALRYEYNEPDRWPTHWGRTFATLRRNWSYHSKFSNYSLQYREDLSDEDITTTNINCQAYNCSPEAYQIHEAAISKNNRCSCSAKSKARKETLPSSYYVHPSEIPSYRHEQSSRYCSRECPNRSSDLYFEDESETRHDRTGYSRRNRSSSNPGHYTRRESYNEGNASRGRGHASFRNSEYIEEHSRSTNASNSRRQRAAGGGAESDELINRRHRRDYDDYLNVNVVADTVYQNAHPVSRHAHPTRMASQVNKRKSRYDEALSGVVSQDLSIVINEYPTNKSKVKPSSINISIKQPKQHGEKRKENISIGKKT